MTKQEAIREVIDLYKEGYCASDNDSYTRLMKWLGELGVVIKSGIKSMPCDFEVETIEGVTWYKLPSNVAVVEPLIG